MEAATLSSKFQICIPKQIREQLNLKAGQRLVFIPKGNTLHLVPQLKIKDVKGILRGANIENIRDHKDRI